MEIKELKLSGSYMILNKPLLDERGFFMRTFDKDVFNLAGLSVDWVQANHSRTIKSGTIRGLHIQLPPFSEAKYIRCIKGLVYDVLVDLRKESKTFGCWDAIELSELNFRSVYIPRGFAHGFCSLTDVSEIIYMVDNYYSREHECGLKWNDSTLGILWPIDSPILSEKDKRNITLNEFIHKYDSVLV